VLRQVGCTGLATRFMSLVAVRVTLRRVRSIAQAATAPPQYVGSGGQAQKDTLPVNDACHGATGLRPDAPLARMTLHARLLSEDGEQNTVARFGT
jgi:hypothetical protein